MPEHQLLRNNYRKLAIRAVIHTGALVPLGSLIYDYVFQRMSANPIQDITFRTGKPALVLLMLTLACTPANSIFRITAALHIRRILGLYVFLYACLHFLVFTGLDYGFQPYLLREAILEKPYALVGLLAFLLLIPLAITSTDRWIQRLGRRWKLLHRSIYLTGLLAIVHYIWLVKSDIRQPLAFGVVFLLLLLARLRFVRQAAKRLRNWIARQ